MENPYLNTINKFLKAIFDNEVLLYSIDTHLKNYEKILKESFKEKADNDFYMLNAFIIGDLTGKTNNGWKLNYPTEFTRVLQFGDLSEHFQELRRRESYIVVAFAYEIFQKLLYDIATIHIFNNQKELDKIKINSSYTYEQLRKKIRNKYKGNSSDEIVELLNKLSTTFHLSSNHLGNNSCINIDKFIITFSEVRQAIIHNENIIKKEFSNKFDPLQLDIMKEYFPFEKNELGLKLSFGRAEGQKILKFVAEAGFLIFKSFSIDEGFEWKI